MLALSNKSFGNDVRNMKDFVIGKWQSRIQELISFETLWSKIKVQSRLTREIDFLERLQLHAFMEEELCEFNLEDLLSLPDDIYTDSAIACFEELITIAYQQQAFELVSVQAYLEQCLQENLNKYLWTAVGKYASLDSAGVLSPLVTVFFSPVMFFRKIHPSEKRQNMTSYIAKKIANIILEEDRIYKQDEIPALAIQNCDTFFSHFARIRNAFTDIFFNCCDLYQFQKSTDTLLQFKRAILESILQLPLSCKLKYLKQSISSQYHLGYFFQIPRFRFCSEATRSRNIILKALPNIQQACIREFLTSHRDTILSYNNTLAKRLYEQHVGEVEQQRMDIFST